MRALAVIIAAFVFSGVAFAADVDLTLENHLDTPITHFYTKPVNGTEWQIYNGDASGILAAPNGLGLITYFSHEGQDTANCTYFAQIMFQTREVLPIDDLNLCATDRIIIRGDTQILYLTHRIGDPEQNPYQSHGAGGFNEEQRWHHQQRAVDIGKALSSFGFWGTLSTDCKTTTPSNGEAISIRLPLGFYNEQIQIFSTNTMNYTITSAVVTDDSNKLRISFGDRVNHRRVYTAIIVKMGSGFQFNELIVTTTPGRWIIAYNKAHDPQYVAEHLIKDSKVIGASESSKIVGDSYWLPVGQNSPIFHPCRS